MVGLSKIFPVYYWIRKFESNGHRNLAFISRFCIILQDMGFQWGDIVVIKNTNSQLPLERGKKINITSSKIKKKNIKIDRREGGKKMLFSILDIRI